jgi:excisionase family DNA binding protein
MIDQELLTIKDVCARYSIGRTTLYREVAAGRLKLRKMGTATRIAREDVEAWMAALPVITGVAA